MTGRPRSCTPSRDGSAPECDTRRDTRERFQRLGIHMGCRSRAPHLRRDPKTKTQRTRQDTTDLDSRRHGYQADGSQVNKGFWCRSLCGLPHIRISTKTP